MTDHELLLRWAGGDVTAGEALFERHFAAVARFFRNKVGSGHEDLIQQTFLGCIEARPRIRGDSSFRTFLFAVARNVLGKHFRRRGREAIDFAAVSVHDLGDSPSRIVARDREQQLLLHALRRLPLDDQIALELHYWEGMTAVEIAELLEIPVGTAKTRLRRARQLLESEIRRLEGPQRLDPTGTGLETWARSLRDTLFVGGD